MLIELYRYETFDDLQTKAEEFTASSTIPAAASAQYKGWQSLHFLLKLERSFASLFFGQVKLERSFASLFYAQIKLDKFMFCVNK